MGGLPARALPHTVTVATPATTTDTYGNQVADYSEGGGATRRTITAWLQQDQRSETYDPDRTPHEQVWLLMTNDLAITADDRIEWADHPTGAKTFTIEGHPEPAYTPSGFHHAEITLRIVDG